MIECVGSTFYLIAQFPTGEFELISTCKDIYLLKFQVREADSNSKFVYCDPRQDAQTVELLYLVEKQDFELYFTLTLRYAFLRRQLESTATNARPRIRTTSIRKPNSEVEAEKFYTLIVSLP